MKKKLSWFKFWPDAWKSNNKLRMCSMASRGLWIEMMCIMHEAEPRGHLTIAGEPVSENALAKIVGESVEDVKIWLSELDNMGVFDRRKNGVIVCRKIERDEKNARKKRENGKKGAAARYGKQTENDGLPWQKSSNSNDLEVRGKSIYSNISGSSGIDRSAISSLAERVEKAYPLKGWRPEGPVALNPALARALRDGADPDGFVYACQEYAKERADYPLKFSNFVAQGVWKAYPMPVAEKPVDLADGPEHDFLSECRKDGASEAKLRTYASPSAGLILFDGDGQRFVTVKDRPHEFQDAFSQTISRLGLSFVTYDFAKKKNWI